MNQYLNNEGAIFGITLVLFFVNLAIGLYLGYRAKRKGYSYMAFTFFSLVFTPILGGLILTIINPRNSEYISDYLSDNNINII